MIDRPKAGGDNRSFAQTYRDIDALVQRGPDPEIERAIRSLSDQHATAYDDSVHDQVGIHFRQTVSVRIDKPRWMPEWAYRRLMRTIVVEERSVETQRTEW